ncbi:hypothetical protein [Geodermatophilus sp. SYSU D01036]
MTGAPAVRHERLPSDSTAAGSRWRTETVVPDGAAGHPSGAQAMDPSLRPPAARVGHDEGRARAGRLSGSWCDA